MNLKKIFTISVSFIILSSSLLSGCTATFTLTKEDIFAMSELIRNRDINTLPLTYKTDNGVIVKVEK